MRCDVIGGIRVLVVCGGGSFIYRMAFASGDLLCQPFKVIGGLI